ncbi:MAG: helix-turn-helix domain-containing protein [Pseudomonadota bacterium]|nr:helix-turn-helix domain-containing protein [Pseudomonadota bacterium]
MTEKYLSFRTVMEIYGVSRSTVYRRVADGTLPQPIRIGKLVRFRRSEIENAL